MKNQGFILLVLLCLVATGCYKDQDNTGDPVTTIETPDIKINTTVYGVVVDESGDQVESYNIVANGNSQIIDQEVFKLQINQGNKRNQHIAINKDGQEIAFANVSLIENDYNKLKLKTFPQWDESSSLNASTPFISNNQFNVELNNGQEANNTIAYGVIEDAEIMQQMGLWARGINDEDYFINPISAFYYNNSQENIISIRNLNGSNSDAIGLFHLDNNFHQWVLIDSFTSDKETIESNDNGYYMLANYSASTFIEGKITFSDLPVSYQKINLESELIQNISITTSENGRWSSFVPDETILTIVIQNPCQDIIAEGKEIMSQDQEVHLSELSPSISTDFLSLRFTNIDCAGNSIAAPGLQIEFGDKTDNLLYGNENVETVISTCGEVNIGGFDYASNMQGPKINWGEHIEDDLGVLSACTQNQMGYSYMKINGEVELLPTFALSENDGNIILSAPDNTIRLKIKGTETGSYLEEQVNIFIEDEDFGKDGYLIRCENSAAGCGIDDCYISHLEDMNNGLSRISFSGTLWMQTINNPTAGNYPVEGQIIIKQ